MKCVIDRSKATLPKGYSLWKVTITYGTKTGFPVLVSAQDKREAINIIKSVYSFLSPKILSIVFIIEDSNIVFDRYKCMILGNMDIKEN